MFVMQGFWATFKALGFKKKNFKALMILESRTQACIVAGWPLVLWTNLSVYLPASSSPSIVATSKVESQDYRRR